MVKTLEQINREFIETHHMTAAETRFDDACTCAVDAGEPAQTEKKRDKGKTARRITDIVLYTTVFIMLITALVLNRNASMGFQVFGYSGFTVAGTSMQSEIPDGSLVLTKKTNPYEINIGDDITFVNKDNSIVTHRVIEIIESSNDSGDRGFLTQGIQNSNPDGNIVYAENIFGVVIYTIPRLGTALSWVSENIGILLLISIIILVIINFSVWLNKKRIGDKQL